MGEQHVIKKPLSEWTHQSKGKQQHDLFPLADAN